jgi:ABC-type transporter Mla subunit MlaD
LNLVRRLAALVSPAIAAFAEPPPVMMALPPALSRFFRQAEERLAELGLRSSADELATFIAHVAGELGEDLAAGTRSSSDVANLLAQVADESPDLEALFSRLEQVEDRLQTLECRIFQILNEQARPPRPA